MLELINPVVDRRYNRRLTIAVLVTVLLTVTSGLVISYTVPLDDSLPIAFLTMLFYIPLTTVIVYAVGKRFSSVSTLVPVFLLALGLRYLVSILFHFNHEGLAATGIRDDVKYYEAGLLISRIIRVEGLSALLDVAGNHSRVGLDSWMFSYFDAIHFLVYPSMLLPVVTLAALNALSGIFLYVIAHLLDLGERVARYSCYLWLFSPAAIGWAAVNHKESLVVPSILACVWAMHSQRHFFLRALVLALALALLAGLRWYIGLAAGVIFLAKIMLDTATGNLTLLRSVVVGILSILILVNITSLIPRYETQLQSPEEAVALFSDIQEQSWERTGTEKAFASAVRARAISPLLGRIVTLFAFFFTPPITRWLGWSEFQVLGTLLFVVLLVYSVWGVTYLWHKDKLKYWSLLALAILIPLLLANVPTLIGSRHRLQVEPLFILFGVVGLTKVQPRSLHIISVIGIVGTILFAAAVDVFF